MIKKPWTPDNCPVQAGMCLRDELNNVDMIVTRRYLNWDDCKDEDKPLLQLGGATTYLTGKDLLDMDHFTYYPDWPCTLEEKPCYHEVEDEPVIISNLVMSIFDGLRSAHIAQEGVHYNKEDSINVWEDDLATAVNNAANDLVKIFKEFKHDEQ